MSGEEPGYELAMPFVTVSSRGGPHDDDAYAAGWEMGQLDTHLEHAGQPFHEQPIRADNALQADLIGMKHGYTVTVRIAADNPDWSWLELSKDETKTPSSSAGKTARSVQDSRSRRVAFRAVVIILAAYFCTAVAKDLAHGGTVWTWLNAIWSCLTVVAACVEAWRLTRRKTP